MSIFSIIIPVYKSSQSLEILAQQFKDLQKQTGFHFEIIFVNDSPGYHDTGRALENIQDQYQDVRVLTLRKNIGQHMAILVGLSQANGDYLITMDDDLQHPVGEIPKLIKKLQEDPLTEVVFAIPGYKNKKHSLLRNISSFLLNRIDTFFLEKPKGLIKSPFRIMTKDVAKFIVSNYNAMPSVSSLLINTTNNIVNLEVEHNTRVYGRSNYSVRKLISLTLNNIIHYSSLPLKFVGFIGFAGLAFSVFFISWTLFRKLLLGITFPGYASTVTLISFFGGLNLFALGIIGEYLIRIIKEQQKIELNSFVKK